MTKQQTDTADKQPLTIDAVTGRLDPTPREIKLKTADDVRLEMGKVYREMRGNRLDMSDGSKLVFVLGQIGKLIELAEFEKRIEQLEKARHENN